MNDSGRRPTKGKSTPLEHGSDRSLGEQVADYIRDAIRRGEFLPGQRLVERKLVEDLGVSHIPIREALTALAEEGIVEKLPRRGARVVALTEKDLDEVSSLRTVLEQFVVSRAQENWTPEREQLLRGIVGEMIAAAKERDTALLFLLDQRFHEQLWEFADHKLLLGISAQLRGRISSFLFAANSALPPDEQMAHAKLHELLVDAIASGDESRATIAMADHIDSARDRISATVTSS